MGAIDTRQQHKYKDRLKKQTPIVGAGVAYTAGNDICFVKCFILPGYLHSATSRRVDCQRINAGVLTLGESLWLVAAERFRSREFHPKERAGVPFRVGQKLYIVSLEGEN